MSRQRIVNVIAARVAQLEQAAWLDVMEDSLPEIDAYFVEVEVEVERAAAAAQVLKPTDELRDALVKYATTVTAQQAKSAYERDHEALMKVFERDHEALMKVFERELAEMRLRQLAKRSEPNPIMRAIDLG